MMNGEQKPAVAKILSAIENGTLPYDETIRRLEEIVDRELEKSDPPADMGLISACEDLLWELNTNGKLPFASHLEANRAAIMKRLSREHKQKAAWTFTLRTIAVTAAAFVLMVVADGVLNHKWLTQYSTDDEQQYVIQGQAVDPRLVDGSLATENQEIGELTTSDWDAVVAFLGYEPKVPTWLPEGWAIRYYYASKNLVSSTLTIYYYFAHVDRESMIWSQERYTDIEDAFATFEQNAMGELITLAGHDIYYTINVDKIMCIWQEEECVSSLSGTAELKDILRIIESIWEE